MTCHNRRSLTLRCLDALRTAQEHAAGAVYVDVYLVDDACDDGTAVAVAERFPGVRIIPGSGSLYWCGGMRLAWRTASQAGGYDGYLWLNDDVQLVPDSLSLLIRTEAQIRRETGRAAIVVGATQDESGRCTSYGEMGAHGVIPAGDAARPIGCFNGNIVLIPADVFRQVGNLSRAFTHGFGDIDYALRAHRRGIPIWLAPGHLGSCALNNVSRWERRDVPLLKRLAALHRPTGCPPWELAFITLRHGGWWFPYTVAKLYWRALFPADGTESVIQRVGT
jgi:GT2 family glycosyltransferase